jgi:cytoskeletal protein RodZ
MRGLEGEHMDHQQPSTSRTPGAGSEHDMTSSPTSGSARQLARKQGLARISAVTLGVGAASVLGAAAIAVTLPGPTTPVSDNAATTLTSDRSSDDSLSDSDDSDDDSGSQLQTGEAPSTTNNPPAATSGGSR